MNRIIKFRGKRIDNNELVYGDLVHDNMSGCYIYPIETEKLYKENAVIPDTVSQFTGLLDKNGKEIYEGDVLMFQNSVKRVVGYEDSHRACFSLLDQHLHYSSSFGSGTYESFYCEVIGNIHDNPELLNSL